ncbi:ATP-binding protein [Spectribacter hydrogenooxidans]|uniref:ATP-binding protein n=1 Tax=Spectribacter hydrogenoxidans TaxID=3075608 RepID=A0ABU3BWH1_9GAMM|nr:ATP-binding protein [Salinisphaera sp. W335]MDT0633638.1 ATP-binding protein [Salinisphaera sp. W335]
MAKFEVRARAVDMLGRQQIAGIPTAIHELFKNAHDAYATRVEADFVRSRKLLVVRDNGLGMTLKDFETKWLALGTESKLSANRDNATTWTGPEKLPPRPVLGEKGIGRLAIATIAPITFAMSRAVRPDGVKEIVASLVDWELFEVPGLNIADIDLPVQTFSNPPDAHDIRGMREHLLENARAVLPPDEERRDEILAKLDDYELNPAAYDQWFSEISEEDHRNLSVSGNDYGTHFYLQPVDSILAADIDEGGRGKEASPLTRMLLGFGNPMRPDTTPPITAEFRDHKPAGTVNELIGSQNFLSAEDLSNADHLFEGDFDDFGQFVGELSIYQGEPERYVLSWPENGGQPTECGPFSVRLAVVHGLADETLLDMETHREMTEKLYRYGGFYVYRDGIRILPYGQSDYDWLKIENRRTLSATDWFFSHRRMIGYVAIDSTTNAKLIEKAGREGFRENKAYRQFKAILENWLQQLAKDYFRKESEHGESFRDKRGELQTQAALLKRRKQQVTRRRNEFKVDLQSVLDRIEAGEPETKLDDVIARLESGISQVAELEPEARRSESLNLETDAYRDIDELESSLTISKPRSFSPSKRDQQAFDNYLDWFSTFRFNQLEPARSRVAEILAESREAWDIEVKRSEIATNALEKERDEALRRIRKLTNEGRQELERVNDDIRKMLTESTHTFKNAVEEVMTELQKTDFDKLASGEAFGRQRSLEIRIDEQLESQCTLLQSLLEQLRGLRTDIEDQTTPEETTAALEAQVAELEERLALYNDLAQAGSAVGIVGHEMENMIGGIREALREIKPWADGTPGLDRAYNKLRNNFDHVDGYLALLAPLSRRVRRKRTDISGTMVLRYVRDAFADRLDKAEVELIATDEFERREMKAYVSTVMATFVNLIDNAVYWITSDRHSERWIKLDADSNGFIISNGGPGVPIRIARQIFDFGISMKPGGRGMGLAVSRDALASIGLRLTLETRGTNTHPVFRIQLDESREEEARDAASG